MVFVGGGNTLYAVDRWTRLGWMVPLLREAAERGCVLTGGPAGAICWFDSGHSDSADPDTYRDAMLRRHRDDDDDDDANNAEESSAYGPSQTKKDWSYLRVPGLGLVPGPFVCCPHHDRVQSNGMLRAHDFDEMLLRRARSCRRSVLGLGIDHHAAFVVEGERYSVFSRPGKVGSVSRSSDDDDDEIASPVFDVDEDGTARGAPGVWSKRVLVDDNDNDNDDDPARRNELVVEAMVCPPEGRLADLLDYGGDNLPGQNNVENDENQKAVEKCRRENKSGISL